MPRSVVTAVDEYSVDAHSVRLECRVERVERPIEADDLTPSGTESDSRFGVDESGEQLGNVPFEGARTVPVTIRFLDPATFRFELRANPEAGRPERLVPLDESALDDTVDLDVERTEDRLVLETDALSVRIGLAEWSFSVADASGTELFAEQRGDVDAKGIATVDPLGFEETTVNRWPYAVESAGVSFPLGADEHFYGLGERFTGFDKRGQALDAWVTQPNGCGSEHAYKNVPFVLSTAGYGLLVDTPHRVGIDLGAESTNSGSVTVHDDTLAFVFIEGPAFEEILESYTALTGRAARPPKWTLGTWLSRYGLTSRELVEDVVERIRAEELPWDGVKLDPYWLRRGHSSDLEWDRDAFPDPAEFVDWLHERDVGVVLWEHPYLPVGTEAFETARDAGYLVEDGGGKPLVLDRLCEAKQRGGIVDFTDEAATEWWQDKHRDLLEMGVDGFWTDFGEYLPRDAALSNGRSGRSMRNVYPDLYNGAVYDVTAEVHGEADAFVWARSGWTGGQAYPMYWSGDPQPTFEAMAATLRGGLSLALSGYPFWSHDVGGFSGEPTRELYVRWAQFGLLSTAARFHGTTPREPWAFGDEALSIVRRFGRLRYSLLPYLYTYVEIATRTGVPVMRPLVLAHQDDPAVRDDGTQYLLGESMLVAPVFDSGGHCSVSLPAGEWVDYWTGERYDGGRTIDRDVPLDEVPLFVQGESVVPRRDPTQSVEPGTPDQIVLETTLSEAGATSTSTPFYDVDADRLVRTTVSLDDARTSLAVSTDGDGVAASIVAVVRGLQRSPESVTVDGQRLDQVADEPESGEWAFGADQFERVHGGPRPGWAYGADGDVLVAAFPGDYE